jgi:hypothetical protein
MSLSDQNTHKDGQIRSEDPEHDKCRLAPLEAFAASLVGGDREYTDAEVDDDAKEGADHVDFATADVLTSA